MKNKLFYTQPTTDLLELRVEGLVCTSILLLLEGGSSFEEESADITDGSSEIFW